MKLPRSIRHRLDKIPRGRGRAVYVNLRGRWKVIYPDGNVSVRMHYDVACDYAKAFDGYVLHIDDAPGRFL